MDPTVTGAKLGASARRRRVDAGWRLWRRWVAATTAGEVLGFGVPATAGAVIYAFDARLDPGQPAALTLGLALSVGLMSVLISEETSTPATVAIAVLAGLLMGFRVGAGDRRPPRPPPTSAMKPVRLHA
jgi:hypothetical protein